MMVVMVSKDRVTVTMAVTMIVIVIVILAMVAVLPSLLERRPHDGRKCAEAAAYRGQMK